LSPLKEVAPSRSAKLKKVIINMQENEAQITIKSLKKALKTQYKTKNRCLIELEELISNLKVEKISEKYLKKII
jgi:hypothetical protein